MRPNHVMAFFERVAADKRLTPFHISLYLALLHHWRSSGFEEQFPFARKSIQADSRIGSLHTIYRCLRDLAEWGYIQYTTSKNPKVGSAILICSLASDASASSTASKQHKKMEPAKIKIPPSLQEVQTYFSENGHPPLEAQKFFNHFQSNGWRVGGKTPMRDWMAAASNWMLNSANFAKAPVQQVLNLNPPKSYNDPL